MSKPKATSFDGLCEAYFKVIPSVMAAEKIVALHVDYAGDDGEGDIVNVEFITTEAEQRFDEETMDDDQAVRIHVENVEIGGKTFILSLKDLAVNLTLALLVEQASNWDEGSSGSVRIYPTRLVWSHQFYESEESSEQIFRV